MRKAISRFLGLTFFTVETLGFYFVYAFAVYILTDGAMIGRLGLLALLAMSVLSTYTLVRLIIDWGD